MPQSIKSAKIQIEGVVRQNVADILSNYPHCGKKKQLEHLWRFAKGHWNYVNDPYISIDTWRSASETINDYYFVNGRCYTGDCDDFAILMASFARQVGFKSRLICAYGESGGHAYAEFEDETNVWLPLDWFSDDFCGKPFESYRQKVYDEKNAPKLYGF